MEILHKQGKDNVVVDALSWKDEEVKAYVILVVVPDWFDEIQGEYVKDLDTCSLIKVRDSNGGMTSFGIREIMLKPHI